MLVLTRKIQEKIHIGDNVTITVVRIQGNTVRVGIEAPQDVRVIRGEIGLVEPMTVDASNSDHPASSGQSTSEPAKAEDSDRVMPGRGTTGRGSARPGKRMSPRSEVVLLGKV